MLAYQKDNNLSDEKIAEKVKLSVAEVEIFYSVKLKNLPWIG